MLIFNNVRILFGTTHCVLMVFKLCNSMKKHIIPITLLILIGILWVGYSFLRKRAEELVKSDANMIFANAVLLDKSHRGEGVLENFLSREEKKKPNDTVLIISQEGTSTITIENKDQMTFDDKKYIFDQLYLLDKNPIQVDQLDSMFHVMLYKNKLHMNTAITYTAKGTCHYSCSDSLFYKKATKLKVIDIGGFIQLQGYVLLSNNVLCNRYPLLGYYVLISIVLLIGIPIYLQTKERKKSINSNTSIQPKENQDNPPVGFISIRKHLFFKEGEGVILYKGQKIVLSKKSTCLLSFFLQSNDGYRSYEELRNNVWRDHDIKKDAIRVAINRLNDAISIIPNFYIETVVGKGYRIVMDENSDKNK